MIDSLDVAEAVIGIDAIGAQTKISEQRRSKQGHYILSVKAKQQVTEGRRAYSKRSTSRNKSLMTARLLLF